MERAYPGLRASATGGERATMPFVRADGFHIGVPFETYAPGTCGPGINEINGRIRMEEKDRANKILAFT
jgi:hypothetical protein